MAGEDLQSCITCGATEKVKRCTRCKKVYYCGTDCQRQDLTRHRKEDGCGPGQVNGSQASHQSLFCTPAVSERPREAGEALKAPKAPGYPKIASGPKCLRCGRPGEDIYAEIAARSIFGPADCKHGPYCRPCAEALQRLTLSFCSGCNALLRQIVPPPSPVQELCASKDAKVVDFMGLD